MNYNLNPRVILIWDSPPHCSSNYNWSRGYLDKLFLRRHLEINF